MVGPQCDRCVGVAQSVYGAYAAVVMEAEARLALRLALLCPSLLLLVLVQEAREGLWAQCLLLASLAELGGNLARPEQEVSRRELSLSLCLSRPRPSRQLHVPCVVRVVVRRVARHPEACVTCVFLAMQAHAC